MASSDMFFIVEDGFYAAGVETSTTGYRSMLYKNWDDVFFESLKSSNAFTRLRWIDEEHNERNYASMNRIIKCNRSLYDRD